MKILFAISKHEKRNKEPQTVSLIKLLKTMSSVLGVFCAFELVSRDFSEPEEIRYFSDISEIKETEWDIFIINNHLVLSEIIKEIKHKPVIVISRDNLLFEFSIFPNLYKIIVTDPEINTFNSDIPDELFSWIPIPIQKESLNFINEPSLRWKDQFKQEVQKILLLFRYQFHEQKVKQLIPVISSKIHIRNFNNDDAVAIINKYTDKIIASVGQDELEIISWCTGIQDINGIFYKGKAYEEEEILVFLNQLFEKKILTFQLLD